VSRAARRGIRPDGLGGSPAPRGRAPAAVLLLLAALGTLATPVAGQAGSQRGLDLSRGVNESLLQVQESWLGWVDSFHRGDRAAASRAVAELHAAVAKLGMARLPDLSLGATARAVEAARQGDLDRARWALDDAEALDPGRAEVAFGRALLEWEGGRYHRAVWQQLGGYLRLLDAAPRGLARLNLLLAGIAVLLLAGGCFVLLQLASKGPALYWGVHRRLARVVPEPVAHALTLALLLWPLVLPAGPLWALLYWAVLLWGFGSVSERVVMIALWALTAVVPFVMASQQQRVAAMLTPPARAIEALAQGRLYGGLFTDLTVLPVMLPQSPAVRQLFGDVHRLIGQWDEARAQYEEVLEQEPTNVAALLDLGAFHARKGDHGSAVQHYQRAAAADPTSAAAYYNLSLAYSDAYQFNEQREALARARALDDSQVTRWIQEPRGDRVVTYDGGIARRDEILADLRDAAGAASTESVEAARRWLPLGLAALAIVLAVVLSRLLPHADTPPWPPGSGRGARLARIALPGLLSAQDGHGGRAFAALVVVGLVVVLLGGARLLFPLPLGLYPGDAAPTAAALLVLALFYGGRVWLDLR
jgi:tetratricopeptide (TPR) repeat protein